MRIAAFGRVHVLFLPHLVNVQNAVLQHLSIERRAALHIASVQIVQIELAVQQIIVFSHFLTFVKMTICLKNDIKMIK